MSASYSPAPGSRREILLIAWPIGVSMLSLTAKGVVDMLMVGQLGTDSLAAVGLANVLTFNLIAFPVGVLRSQKSLVSQYLGAGDKHTSISFGAHAAYLAGLMGLICLALSFVAEPLLRPILQRTELSADAIATSIDYLSVRVAFALPYLLAMSVAEYLRGTGETRRPMMADLIAHPLNFLFNYLLIFGQFGLPELGARGAAIGTGLADSVSLLLLLFFIRPRSEAKPPWAALRLKLRRLWRTASVGFAGGLQFTLEVGAFAIISLMIGHLGTQSLAAHQAALQVIHVSFMPGIAIGDGTAVLIGRYVGEMRWDVVRKAFRNCLFLIQLFMLTMGVIFLTLGEEITALFLNHEDPLVEAEAIHLGGKVMMVAALWQVLDAFQIAYRFALRATGDHRWVMWVGILCAWGLSMPLAYLTVFELGGNVVAVWAVWSVELGAGAYIFYRRWKGGKWQRQRLVRDQDRVQHEPEALVAESSAGSGAPA